MKLDKRQETTQLAAYINRGNVGALQTFFAEATENFATLRKIARGESVDGRVPTIQEMLQANKMIVEKIFPTLRASHVVQEHRKADSGDDLDVAEAKRQLADLLVEVEGLDA